MGFVTICRHQTAYLIAQIEIVWEQENARDDFRVFRHVIRLLFPRVLRSPSLRQSCQIHRARNQADVAERLGEVA
jgi:hypothetical protein